MASKKKTTGKRYTTEEKQQIVDFVNQVNAEKGRGGVTAAVKKFGASALTIAGWVKGTVPVLQKGNRGAGSSKTSNNRSEILAKLGKLDREIATKRKELGALEHLFDQLKGKL